MSARDIVTIVALIVLGIIVIATAVALALVVVAEYFDGRR